MTLWLIEYIFLVILSYFLSTVSNDKSFQRIYWLLLKFFLFFCTPHFYKWKSPDLRGSLFPPWNFFLKKFGVYYNDSSPLIINPPFEFKMEDLFWTQQRVHTSPHTLFLFIDIKTEILLRRETFHTQAADAAIHTV